MQRKNTVRTATMEAHPCLVWTVLGTVCLMSIGKNFVTVNMAIAQDSFKASEGLTSAQVSVLFAAGFGFSCFGKVAGGLGSDSIGGRGTCIAAMVVYSAVTLLFTFMPDGTDYTVFAFLWGLNVLCSLGIMGVSRVALATNWIPAARLGTLMSLVAMSTDIGDVLSRLILAPFLQVGWKAVFRVSAAIAFASGAPLFFITDSPGDPEDTMQAGKQIATEGQTEESFWQKVKPLLAKPMLYALCILSGVLYGTRSLLLNYTPSFLAEVRCRELGEDLGECLQSPETLQATALASTTFTFFGLFSPVVVGYLKDSLPKQYRSVPLIVTIGPLTVVLAYLALVGTNMSFVMAVVMMSLAGTFLAGPFKTIGPVFAVDVAGKKAKGTALSIVGIMNNLAAMAMILVKGIIGQDWQVMWSVLGGMSGVALLVALAILVYDSKGTAVPTAPSEPLIQEKLTATQQSALQRRQSFLEHKHHD
eukprot:TRINITY_DN42943_c0_g1_i1.p1 TRINITY_DN42943_c0_g1~~TRINITY_DN42943_c0_g1_i1.p1  ORF type:complete len:475 (-),score=89.59 TRINITY_DN42943_c0_g1_i1:89-1513(-)